MALSITWEKGLVQNTLRSLFDEHTGKVTDKWSIYLDVYEQYLWKFRDKPVRILEIGVQNGGSLEIWRKYFPNAKAIVGCDINPACSNLSFEEKEISIIIGDANSEEAEREIRSHSSEYDIIIDDGSHKSTDYVRSFTRYFRYLSNDGLYIAEDLHCSYWKVFEGGLYDPYSSISFFKRIVDVVNNEHWGVSKNRTDVLKAFADKYSVKLDEAILKTIHSVEFINSLCILKKSPFNDNLLGPRRVSGKQAIVAEEIAWLNGDTISPSDEANNPWSLHSLTIEEEIESHRQMVVCQKKTIELLNSEIETLRADSVQEIGRLSDKVDRKDLEIREVKKELVNRMNEIQLKEANWTIKCAQKDGRIAELGSELHAIYTGRIWRYVNVLRRIVSLPTRISLYMWRTIAFQPLHDVEKLAEESHITKWSFTGEDPQFQLKLPGDISLGPGRYKLEMEVPACSADLDYPYLYIDSGCGYNNAERVTLNYQLKGNDHYIAAFTLYGHARKLRFDPCESPLTILIGRIRIRKLSRLEFYSGLIGRLVTRRLTSGNSLFRLAIQAGKLLRTKGIYGLAAAIRSADSHDFQNGPCYEAWVAKYDNLTEADIVDLRQHINKNDRQPLISVLMPVYNTPEKFLKEAVESVLDQAYENWELCIADDCSTQRHVKRVLDEYARRDSRIKVIYRTENGHISRASNSALELIKGEWVAMLDHDDLLRPNALAEVVLVINRHPNAELIYSDEDKIDALGRRYDPYFKPDFSRELFRSQNYLNHLTVHRSDNIRAVGGWRVGFEGSQDYDLNLRIFERIDPKKIWHIPKILYHWRAANGSTALKGTEKSYAYLAGLKALNEHVGRVGLPAQVKKVADTSYYRIHFSVPEPQPLVSLVVPTRDNVEMLSRCIESIQGKTTYPNYEIIVVDNGSVQPKTFTYFEDLQRMKNVQILRYNKPFNFSAINNFAVKLAKGSIIGLINNDIEVISPNWLTEMVSWAVQPDVGCVGAKLYYSNDTVQHAGIILGIGGVAGHSHKYFSREADGYFSRLKVVQNLSAVTAACLVVRKSVYEEVGGLNESDLAVAFNDVDFCLKVREVGYWNVWTPYAELYHLESISRGAEDNPEKLCRFQAEVKYMQQQWELVPDPYYSVNLTLVREDFSIK